MKRMGRKLTALFAAVLLAAVSSMTAFADMDVFDVAEVADISTVSMVTAGLDEEAIVVEEVIEISSDESDFAAAEAKAASETVNLLGGDGGEEFTGLCFTADGDSTITLTKVGEPIWSGSFKKNGGEWTVYTLNTPISLSKGDKVYFKGNLSGCSSSKYLQFVIPEGGQVAASGNIMSLCSGDGYKTATTIPCKYCFYKLFCGCASLTSAPELPATTLTMYCYNYMFEGCTSLTAAPVLPATTLVIECYVGMFSGCTNLTTAPALPAIELARGCYQQMFSGCSGLTAAPALPVTTLTDSCYAFMFEKTGLTSAPALPATSLVANCYKSMFSNCENLTSAPALPATELAANCYNSMFNGCISLKMPPALSATTLDEGSCNEMFSGCTRLNVFDVDGDGFHDLYFENTSTYEMTDMFKDIRPGNVSADNQTAKPGNKYYIRGDISKATVTLEKDTYEYTGEPIKPVPTKVEYKGKKLSYGAHYTLSYSNCTNPGTATITLSGTGTMDFMKEVTFTIIGKDSPQPDSEPERKPTPTPTPKPTPAPSGGGSSSDDYIEEVNTGSYNANLYGGNAPEVTGEWTMDPSGQGWNLLLGGEKVVSSWKKVSNPYAPASMAKVSWFYFDENGIMLTGWQWIKGSDGLLRCYYLNPVSNGLLGACFLGGKTPDGYTVDRNGAWTVNGKVQTR